MDETGDMYMYARHKTVSTILSPSIRRLSQEQMQERDLSRPTEEYSLSSKRKHAVLTANGATPLMLASSKTVHSSARCAPKAIEVVLSPPKRRLFTTLG